YDSAPTSSPFVRLSDSPGTTVPAAFEPANRISVAARDHPPPFTREVDKSAPTDAPRRYTNGRPADSQMAIVFDSPSVTAPKPIDAFFGIIPFVGWLAV